MDRARNIRRLKKARRSQRKMDRRCALRISWIPFPPRSTRFIYLFKLINEHTFLQCIKTILYNNTNKMNEWNTNRRRKYMIYKKLQNMSFLWKCKIKEIKKESKERKIIFSIRYREVIECNNNTEGNLCTMSTRDNHVTGSPNYRWSRITRNKKLLTSWSH